MAEPNKGWANRIWPRSISMTPASTALASASAAFRRPPIAACTTSTVGEATAAATSSASLASSGRAETRRRTSSRRLCGTGSSCPVTGRSPRSDARAISMAKNGFPPDISWSRTSVGRRSPVPNRARNRFPIASTPSGPTVSRRNRLSGSIRSSPSGTATSSPDRAVAMTPTGSPSRRRRANSRTREVGASSHWTSSTASTTGALRLSERSTSSTARETARLSGGAPSGSARSRATSRARACGTGREAAASSTTPPSRSPSAANDSLASDSTGWQIRTR